MTIIKKSHETLTQQVFISYSNESPTDRQVADWIYDSLKAREIPCWVAHRDIPPGKNWPDEISKAISNSRVMIVVLSEHTQKSHYVDREVTQAADENLTIIPFCIEEVSLPGGLKLLLGNRQWINAYPHPVDKYLDRLVENLQAYLGIESGKAFKKEGKPLGVDIETVKPVQLKHALIAASIIIAVIAAVFFSQTENNTGMAKFGNILTAEVIQKGYGPVLKYVGNVKKKVEAETLENKLTKIEPEKRKEGIPIGEQRDFIKVLISKGWVVKKIGNNSWEALYNKEYDITMIYIPQKKFMMGANDGEDDEKPPHEVDLDGYWIGKYEVTFAQYDRYCEKTGKTNPDAEDWGRENWPVIHVSWDDAVAYCKWLSQKTGLTFKLPTEAQWEKAARGTNGLIYPWGNDFDMNKCNSKERRLKRTVPVDTNPSGMSPYGCMDMAGNVWEWCADWYNEDYYKESPAKNPQGPISGKKRVMRGGSWDHESAELRCAARGNGTPRSNFDHVGFRLVCVPPFIMGK